MSDDPYQPPETPSSDSPPQNLQLLGFMGWTSIVMSVPAFLLGSMAQWTGRSDNPPGRIILFLAAALLCSGCMFLGQKQRLATGKSKLYSIAVGTILTAGIVALAAAVYHNL